MSMFKSRVAKLEEISRLKNGDHRAPGVPDEMMAEVHRVAAICGNWQELAAFLATLLPNEERDVVAIDDKQRRDAVLAAMARSIMDEVHADIQLQAG
jgi:hypothetical protein